MILGPNVIKTIEGFLEKGHTVELRVEGGKLGDTVTVDKRSDSEDEIRIHPTLVNQAAPTNLTLCVWGGGQDPVVLGTVIVPAGFEISGIKGHQGISQEIPG